MRKRLLLFLVMLAAVIPANAEERLRIATTTSTVDTGLLDSLLPPFEKMFKVKADVLSVGTGKAIALARNGDVDVILVHARKQEDEFVAEGHGVNRRDVMYNDFVIVGPTKDPAGIKKAGNAIDAMVAIALNRAPFVSRADDSGTHQREKELWREAKVTPKGKWYMETGQGMGAALIIADEKGAYCLSDRATYNAFSDKIKIRILFEGDRRLINPYGIIAVNPAVHPNVNYLNAICLIGWVTSPKGQEIIGTFKKKGVVLFHPLACPEVR